MTAAYPRAVSHFGEAAMQPPPQRPLRAPAGPEGAVLRPPRRTVVRLWLPLTPILWLLSPFPLILAPFGYLVPPRFRPDPFFLVFAVGELLLSLSGTEILVDTTDAYVRLKIL
jgi:hypothetical protein